MMPNAVWYALAALGGLLLWRGAKAVGPARAGSPFVMTNQVRYWRADLAPTIANMLSRYDIGVHLAQDGTQSGVERVYTLYPKGKGAKPALVGVKELQAQPGVVTSTTNLLDTSATAGPKGIAVLLPAEFPKKAENAEGVAVLPKLL